MPVLKSTLKRFSVMIHSSVDWQGFIQDGSFNVEGAARRYTRSFSGNSLSCAAIISILQGKSLVPLVFAMKSSRSVTTICEYSAIAAFSVFGYGANVPVI